MLPDACVAIVVTAGRLTVSRPATAAADAPATPGHDRRGVRFRIGSAGAVLRFLALAHTDLARRSRLVFDAG